VAEADAEDGQLAHELPYRRHAYAGLGRRAGSGRKHQSVGSERGDASDVDLVVAQHLHLAAELAEVLHQVEGEAVELSIMRSSFSKAPSSTNSAARISALALASVSCIRARAPNGDDAAAACA
jgi:hypothetical protein